MRSCPSPVRRAVAALVLSLAATAVFAGTSFRLEVGPPAALGLNEKMKVKGAAFAVRALVCDDLAHVRVTATAETIVNGARRSVPMPLLTMSTPGVYAVSLFTPQGVEVIPRGTPDGGRWLIHLTGTCSSPKAGASTIVPMQDATYVRDKVQVLREPATPAQIEATLAGLARSSS